MFIIHFFKSNTAIFLKFSKIIIIAGVITNAMADPAAAAKRSADATAVGAKIDSAQNNSPKKHILLTNMAEFKGDRTLEGASGFLINYHDNNYAVTARHLLGEAGGIEPEIKTSVLAKNLIEWKMAPRVAGTASQTIKLNANGLDYSRSDYDLLLLNVEDKTPDLAILKPRFSLPEIGEALHLIGCPYSERQCRQNSYDIKYVEYSERFGVLVCEIKSDVELAGFSGAPVVNDKNEVVGVLVSGAEVRGKMYIFATHIKEIQRIKHL